MERVSKCCSIIYTCEGMICQPFAKPSLKIAPTAPIIAKNNDAIEKCRKIGSASNFTGALSCISVLFNLISSVKI